MTRTKDKSAFGCDTKNANRHLSFRAILEETSKIVIELTFVMSIQLPCASEPHEPDECKTQLTSIQVHVFTHIKDVEIVR